MKYKNKFIAAGLGIAIASTGTYFSHSWFTDSDKLRNNTVSIGELVKSYDYMTEARIEEDRKQLEIDLPEHLKEHKHYEVKATIKTGEFAGNSEEKIDDKEEIDIDYSGKKIDINKISACDYIIVEIKYTDKDGRKAETYKITFDIKDKDDKKLNAYWTKQGKTLTIESEELEEDLPKEDEVTPPENGEEVNPDLPGENTKPVIPPSDEVETPGSGTDPDNTKPQPPGPIEKPDTDKPSTEEGTQKPEPPKEEQKPEVVAPPKPEPQPDTPTTMPLD